MCIRDRFSNDANTQVVPANNITDGWEGLDAGPETQKAFAAAIEDAKTILWNGPAGVFEFDKDVYKRQAMRCMASTFRIRVAP